MTDNLTNDLNRLNGLDEFPKECNLDYCQKIIEKKQATLIRQVRAQFNELITNACNKAEKFVLLPFPENLWNDRKKIIVKELLGRFGSLIVDEGISNGIPMTTRVNLNDYDKKGNNEIFSIKIEFVN